jgi:hypothetical protein
MHWNRTTMLCQTIIAELIFILLNVNPPINGVQRYTMSGDKHVPGTVNRYSVFVFRLLHECTFSLNGEAYSNFIFLLLNQVKSTSITKDNI